MILRIEPIYNALEKIKDQRSKIKATNQKSKIILTSAKGKQFQQTKAIEYILQHDRLTIQNYEGLCPEVNRRSLQRDLKIMIEKELIGSEGATNQLVYFLRVG